MEIKHVANNDIDKQKWDARLFDAHNSRVYAASWYLDNICEKWDALIADDYDYIMPLPTRKKYGMDYIFVPIFVQQLGVFSKKIIDEKIIVEFIKAIPKKFCYCDIALNSNNFFTKNNAILRKNYLLLLDNSYNLLQKQYSRMANRKIKLAISEGISCEQIDTPINTIQLHRKRFKDNVGATIADYTCLEKLLIYATSNGYAISFVAKKEGVIIASSTYLLYSNRIVFLLNGNTPSSLENGATHLLKDYVINHFAGTNLTMDFEGSDHPNFARFYEQFGASEIEYYPQFIINNLPYIFRWLKPSSIKI